MSPDPTTVYTDGACLGNPGPGGWAWAVPGGRYRSGADAWTTNQRMEIRAALDAVNTIAGPMVVVSDSTYVVNCFRDRWWEGWLARGWLNTAKKPVANRDLWEPLIQAYRSDPGRVKFRWVKGHSTDAMNDLVDRLAVAAAASQSGREGTGVPESLGPADSVGGAGGGGGVPGAGRPGGVGPGGGLPGGAELGATAPRGGSDPRVPEGHKVVVTGLKPPGLGGYDDNATAARVRARLAEILAAKRGIDPDLTVLTGLGLGAEQLAAEAAAAEGIPYVAVLAFPGVERVWPDSSRRKFAQLLAGAGDTIVLQSKVPESKQTAGGALARRDAWLARHADEAIVVWDGDDAAIGRTVRSLQDHLGEEQVWILEPAVV